MVLLDEPEQLNDDFRRNQGVESDGKYYAEPRKTEKRHDGRSPTCEDCYGRREPNQAENNVRSHSQNSMDASL